MIRYDAINAATHPTCWNLASPCHHESKLTPRICDSAGTKTPMHRSRLDRRTRTLPSSLFHSTLPQVDAQPKVFSSFGSYSQKLFHLWQDKHSNTATASISVGLLGVLTTESTSAVIVPCAAHSAPRTSRRLPVKKTSKYHLF